MVKDEKSLRTFIAVELSPALTALLEDWQADLRRRMPAGAVRWTRPAGIHVTLKFLGETPASKLSALRGALAQTARPLAPFVLHSAAYGCFPHCRRPRVVWLGIAGDIAALQILQHALEQHIAPLGWPTEKRGFSPHLTLGRLNRNTSARDIAAVGEIVRTTPAPPIEQWLVDSVTFFRSTLRPGGAVYTPLGRFPFTSLPAG